MSNSKEAILINKISKTYFLYKNPGDRVKETFHPFGKKYHIPFHALKSISIEIGWGETVGIVGRNGCGKSTLLQIVCGIMPPTTGQIVVNGRVSAILELGAGFNQEFTGKDNVYLNCSILGMDRVEVDERYDDICEFADIGNFIDQPIKLYSSGMIMRLAFSIAINVDPAILVIDEALAVGDSAFQRKCFSKIKEIQESGATILFVSHNAGSVVELCDRAIFLDQGMMLYSGSPKKAVSYYHSILFAPTENLEVARNSLLKKIKTDENNTSDSETSHQNAHGKLAEVSKATFNANLVSKSTDWYIPNGAMISDPQIQTLNGRKINRLVRDEEYYFSYRVNFTENVFNVRFGMLIKTVKGFELGGYGHRLEDESLESLSEGDRADVRLRFRCLLLPGFYFLNAGVYGITNGQENYLHRGIDIVMFEVMPEQNIGMTAVVDFGIIPEVKLSKLN